MVAPRHAAAPLVRLSLRMIAYVDFRFGVRFHYEALKKKRLTQDIADDETILLVSMQRLQLAFVFQEASITARGGEPVRALGHYRVQLDRHTPFSRERSRLRAISP